MSRAEINRTQVILLLAAIAAAAFWAVPPLRLALQPLYLFNTHLHELAHAIAALVTGGFPAKILVHADGSGVTSVRGGNGVIIASAGYVGTAVLGSGMIAWASTPQRSAWILRSIGGVLLVALILLLRGDWVGVISGYAWAILLLAIPGFVGGEKLQFVTQFLGIQLCLTAIQAFFQLAGLGGSGVSDATILESGTGVPAGFWVTGWALISAAALWTSLHQAWRTPSRPANRRSGPTVR